MHLKFSYFILTWCWNILSPNAKEHKNKIYNTSMNPYNPPPPREGENKEYPQDEWDIQINPNN